MLGLCTAETVVCWAYRRRRSWSDDNSSPVWDRLWFVQTQKPAASVGDHPLRSKRKSSQPGRRHEKARLQRCSSMQLDTGQRKQRSVVAVHSALEATVTRHVKNAQCDCASIISTTASSCIIRSSWIKTLPFSHNFMAYFWHWHVTLNFTVSVSFADSVFLAFLWFSVHFYIFLSLSCSLPVMYCLYLKCIHELISVTAILNYTISVLFWLNISIILLDWMCPFSRCILSSSLY